MARSFLLFARAKALGPHGLDWLKIHLVNLTGVKKRASNAERLRHANEKMDEILDSADNPFNVSTGLISKGAEPWRTKSVAAVRTVFRAPHETSKPLRWTPKPVESIFEN